MQTQNENLNLTKEEKRKLANRKFYEKRKKLNNSDTESTTSYDSIQHISQPPQPTTISHEPATPAFYELLLIKIENLQNDMTNMKFNFQNETNNMKLNFQNEINSLKLQNQTLQNEINIMKANTIIERKTFTRRTAHDNTPELTTESPPATSIKENPPM